MSVPSLSDLIVTRNQGYWTTKAIQQLQGRNFPTTDWTPTSPERAMIETDTACLADLSTNIPLTVQLVLVLEALQNPDPDGSPSATPALQFLAYNFYSITPFPATATVGTITLTCASTAGPYTIAVGQLTAQSASGLLYTNTTGGTLSSGSTLDLDFQCTQVNVAATNSTPAINGNVNNSTITTLLTPLPGVTIDNAGGDYTAVTHYGPGTGTLTLGGTPIGSHSVSVLITGTGEAGVATWSTSLDGAAYVDRSNALSVTNLGGDGINITLANGASTPSFVAGDVLTFSTPGSWITSAGRFPETQVSLAARCLARWPSLAQVPNLDVYSAWAIESSDGTLSRVYVETDPSVTATVEIYVAQSVAPATATQVSDAQTYIDARCPITDLPVVNAASSTAITLTADADYPAGRADGHADLDDMINAYVSGVAIGGKIECAQIAAIAMQLDANNVPTGATNITNINLGSGVGVDVTLAAYNIVDPFTNSITWTAV